MIGKKGITSTLLVLIISSIAVSLLFLGVFSAYKSLAEEIGVEFTKVSLSQKPHYGYKSQIIIESVDRDDINQSKCISECEGNPACRDSCIRRFPDPQRNASRWIVHYYYKGLVSSELTIHMIEESMKGGVLAEIPVYLEKTDYLVSPFSRGTFEIILNKTENCHSKQTIFLDAERDPNAVTVYEDKDKFEEEYDFCVTPPQRDVNASVHNLVYDSNTGELIATFSIDGSDVPNLCPVASAAFMGINKSGDGEVLLANFLVDTNRSNSNPHWLDLNYFYRVKFKVINDVGEGVSNEVAVVELNLSDAYLGVDVNLTDEDCQAIKIARADVDQKTALSLSKNVTVTHHDEYGNCDGVKIEFVINSLIPPGKEKEYYAYFGEGTAGLDPNVDVSGYYPEYTLCGIGCNYNWGSAEKEMINLTTDRFSPDLTLKETICKGSE